MDESKASQEPKVRIIEKSLKNLDLSIRNLEIFVQSLDSDQIATPVKSSEPTLRSEFQLWRTIGEEIQISSEKIQKIEAFLRENIR